EHCLTGANEKFIRRFSYIERALAARGKTPDGSSLEEMDALWDEAKETGL
ncbi:MAG: nucleoside triphosphate pyrophosphohydrolase, partial [Acidocella sp. 20-61-6]